MRLVVKLVHLVRRNASAKFDVFEFQLARQRFQRRTLTAVARNNQPGVRISLLDLGKRPQDAGNVVQRIKVSIRQKDRLQRFPFFVLEPLRVENVGHRRRAQSKFPKDVDEVLRRHDQLIGQPHDRDRRPRPRAKMILTFAAAIVQYDFLLEQTAD